VLHRYESTLLPNRMILIAQCTHADMKISDMLDEVELSVLASLQMNHPSRDQLPSSLLTFESVPQPGVPMTVNGKREEY
jgi:hypothetical protein